MSLDLLPVPGEPAGGAERRDRHFRALAEAIAEILFVTTADGRAVEMPAWQELTGQTSEEIAEFGWLAALHPDDIAETNARWQRALATQTPFRTNYRIRDRDGRYRWFQARGAPVRDSDGSLREWIGVCIDIEDRKQAENEAIQHAEALRNSEQRFRSLVQAVAAIVWMLPPSGKFEREQPEWARFTGQSFEEYRGEGWLEAVHPADRAGAAAEWSHAYSTTSLYQSEHRLRRADGTYVPMTARAIPILDAGRGEVREWIGFHVDVSRLRRVEEDLRELTADLERRVEQRTSELNEAHRALREAHDNLEAIVQARTAALTAANEEIQRFAYIVSHDLRAPLVNIMGFANELRALRDDFQAMLDGIDPAARVALGDRPARLGEEINESLDFILQSTAKMDRLIGAILRLSREGRRAFTAEPVHLADVFASIAGSLAHQAGERDATIEIAPDLPTLTADRLAVEQILTNVVENAVKYLKPGRPGLIRIAAVPSDDPEEVVLAIADNGRGIAERDLDRVFELFRRAGPQDQPGDGIGLAFVQTQMRRLGGRVACRSVEGEGTTFTLAFPRHAPRHLTPPPDAAG